MRRKRGWFAALTTAVLINMILAPVGYSESEAPRGKPRGILAEPCEAKDAILLAKKGQHKLLLHWDFENITSNIVRDVSGNNNNGLIKGTIARGDGLNGKCAVLNGKKGFIECMDNDLLNPPYITIEFLLCPLAWDDGTANAIIDKGWAEGWGIDPHFYGPEIHFCAYIGGARCDLGKRGANSEPDIKLNEWSHVAITYDGTNMSIYKNGHILKQTKKDTGSRGDAKDGKPLSSVLDSAFRNLQVGGLSEAVVKIDEIKIHGGALTSVEVLNASYGESMADINSQKLIINGCKYITNSMPLFEIHTATNSTEITTYAANELKAYLDKIFGCKINVRAVNGPVDTNKPGVVIINYEMANQWNISTGPAYPDGYEIQRKGNVIYIIGHDSPLTKDNYNGKDNGTGPAGTLFGVYRLLEELGVYWFFPGDEYEVLPAENAINVTIDKIADHPYFVVRDADAPPLVDQKWMRQIGFGGVVFPAYTEHSFAKWPKQYRKTHPEYLNLLENNQRGNDLCYFNPQVQEQILKDAREFFDTHDAGIYPDFTICRNDGDQPSCRCKLCQKHVVYEQGFFGQMSDSLCETAIQLAKGIKVSHPNRRVVIIAYNNSLLPPVRLKEQFPDNLSVQICRQSMLLWDAQARKRVYDDIFRGWMKLKPATVSFTDYYNFDCWGGEKWQGVPGVSFKLIRDDIKKLHDMAEESKIPFLGETIRVNGRSHEFARERLYWMAPNLYVTAKMLWHPERDLNELLDRFYSVYFGKAGPAMKEFYGTLEAVWSSGKWGKYYPAELGITLDKKPYSPVPGVMLKPASELPDTCFGNSPWDRLFTPSVIKKLIKNLSDAKGLAKVQPYKRRLELIEYGFKYTIYQYMKYGSDSPGKLSGEAQAVW